jgi:hypothetical protein
MLSMNIRRIPKPGPFSPGKSRTETDEAYRRRTETGLAPKRTEVDDMSAVGKRSLVDDMSTEGKRSSIHPPTVGKRYVAGVDLFAAAHPAAPAKPAHVEPQTLQDIVKERQGQIDKLDAHLQQMNDPNWLADQKAKVEKKRASAEHELEILKAAEGGAPKAQA